MMELFLITKLRHRIIACLEETLTPVRVADLLGKLRLYMVSHEIELADRGIILPALSFGSSSEIICSDDVSSTKHSARCVDTFIP